MKRKHIIQIIGLLALIGGTIFIAFQQHNATYRKYEGQVFGTYFHITYQCPENLDKDIMLALQRVDESLSMFNQQSTIHKINDNTDSKTDAILEKIFPEAIKISQNTHGAFDITVAPLVNAWGFGFKNNQKPTDKQVDSLLQFVGYNKVSLKDHQIKKQNPNINIDLSAIAKGYGCDIVAETLKKAKVENFMIEIGGEVVVSGKNEKGEPWRIGVARPTEDDSAQQDYVCVLKLTDRAMATSGNYRNFYYEDGVRYAHTIDPRTGRPVQQDIISATVLAPNCYEADAYATSFMVMGLEKAKGVLAEQKQLDAVLIYLDKDGKQQVWMTEGIKSLTITQ